MEEEPIYEPSFKERFDVSALKDDEAILKTVEEAKNYVIEHYPDKIEEPEIQNFLTYCITILKDRSLNNADSFAQYLQSVQDTVKR